MRELRRCLEDRPAIVLQGIAQSHGLVLAAEEKAEMVEELAHELLRPGVVASALARLSLREREALDALLAEQGRMRAYLFTHRFGQVRPFGAESLRRVRPWASPANPAERLYFLGILARTFGVLGDYRGEVFFVPQDLLPLLPEVEKPTISQLVKAVPTPPVVREANLSLVRDVYSLLAYLDAHPIELGTSERISASDWRSLRRRLLITGTEDELDTRLIFVRQLAQGLGLVTSLEGSLRLGQEAHAWLRAAMPDRIRSLWNQWQGDRFWNDLWHVEGLRCRDSGWQNDPLATRRAFLKDLRQCPAIAWISTQSLVDAIRALDPDLQRPDGDYTAWYIRDAETGEFLGDFQHWDRVEGALIRFYLTYPLQWLGAVSLGYEHEDQQEPSAFLITNLGASFLGLPHQEIVELPRQSLVVEANFQVTVPAEAGLYDRFQLERFAELEVPGAESIYRIRERSVLGLLRRGVGVERMVRFLERASGGELPSNVALAMREWARSFVGLRLRRVTLLEGEDDQLLTELRALPELAPLIDELISSRAAIIPAGREEELISRLRELGYSPEVQEENGDS